MKFLVLNAIYHLLAMACILENVIVDVNVLIHIFSFNFLKKQPDENKPCRESKKSLFLRILLFSYCLSFSLIEILK